MESDPGRARVQASALAALLAVLTVWMSTGAWGVWTGSALLGAGTADTWGHAWGYGWTADALLAGELPFMDAPVDHPGKQHWWVIDLPIAILLTPLTAVAGAAVSYNVAILLHVAVGAGATTALIWSRGGSRALAIAGGVAVVNAPFVRGVIISGVPEALGILVVPLLVLWLDRGLRDGARPPLLGAAVISTVLVLDGVYGALAGACAGAASVLAALWTAPHRWRVVARAGVVAVPAAVAAGLMRAALHVSAHPALYNAKVRTVLIGESWALQPLGGSDLAAWSLPAQVLPLIPPGSAHRHIVYVGAMLPLALLWAAWRSPAARRPAAVAGMGAMLALGPALFIWGEPMTPAVLPGTLLWLGGATNLYRLAGLVPVMGIIGLAVALSDPARRSGGVALMGAIVLEWVLGSPVSTAIPTTTNPIGRVEAWLAMDPGEGAVLDLPFDREGSRSRGPWPQRTFFLATEHGRPLASGLYKAATMETRNPPLGAFSRAVRVSWRMRDVPAGARAAPKVAKLPAPPRDRAVTDLKRLLTREGFSHVTLDRMLLVEAHRAPALEWMEAWLGPAAVVSDDGMRHGWRISSTAANPTPSAPAATESAD